MDHRIRSIVQKEPKVNKTSHILTIKYITSFSLLYAPIVLKSRRADSKCFFACSTSTRPSLENLLWLVVRLMSGETVSGENEKKSM